MRLIFVNTDLLLPPVTGVRQGFRGVYAALAERHSHAGECASCKEGWDGRDSNVDAPFSKAPPSRPSPTQRGKEIQPLAFAAYSIKSQAECNTALATGVFTLNRQPMCDSAQSAARRATMIGYDSRGHNKTDLSRDVQKKPRTAGNANKPVQPDKLASSQRVRGWSCQKKSAMPSFPSLPTIPSMASSRYDVRKRC